MTNKPRIRFKGFDEEWKRTNVGNLAGRTFGGGTPKTNVEEYWGGDIPWIQSSNLLEHQMFNIDIRKYITKEGLQKSAAQLVPGNSIAVVSHVGVGKLLFIPFEYTSSQDFISLSELKSEPIFTCYALYKRLQEDLHIVQGSAIKGITKEDLLNKTLAIPCDKEQLKIGSMLKNIDRLITLNQRKLESLKQCKKYMLSKMFPKEGETVPKIRFEGFTGDWEQRKFGDVVQTRRGLTYKPTDIEENGIRVLRSSNIDEDTFVYGDDDVFVNPKAVNIEPVRKNDILITSANGSSRLVGKHALIQEIPDDSAVHGGFMLLGRTKNYDFVNASMSSSWYTKFINVFVAGGNGAIGNLNKNDLDEQVILVPNDAEQTKIGNYFRNLDHLITLHQRKLDSIKQFKKYMLQNMFPSAD